MELVSRFAIESLHIGGDTIFIEFRKQSVFIGSPGNPE